MHDDVVDRQVGDSGQTAQEGIAPYPDGVANRKPGFGNGRGPRYGNDLQVALVAVGFLSQPPCRIAAFRPSRAHAPPDTVLNVQGPFLHETRSPNRDGTQQIVCLLGPRAWGAPQFGGALDQEVGARRHGVRIRNWHRIKGGRQVRGSGHPGDERLRIHAGLRQPAVNPGAVGHRDRDAPPDQSVHLFGAVDNQALLVRWQLRHDGVRGRTHESRHGPQVDVADGPDHAAGGQAGGCIGLFGVEQGSLLRIPGIVLVEGCGRVRQGSLGCGQLPAAAGAGRPPEQGGTTDLLVSRTFVPPVDFPVDRLHPSVLPGAPGLELVRLHDVYGQLAHMVRNAAHEVAVGPETTAAAWRVLGDPGIGGDVGGIVRDREGMQRNAVAALGPQPVQDVAEIGDPVPALVARIAGVGVPWGNRPRNDECIRIGLADGLPALPETGDIAVRVHGFADGGQVGRGPVGMQRVKALGQGPQHGLHLRRILHVLEQGYPGACVGARARGPIVELVSNHPVTAAARDLDETAAAPREFQVVVDSRQRAVRVETQLQFDNDTVAAFRPGTVIHAGAVGGVHADEFVEHHPAVYAGLFEEMLAARVVQTVDV